MWNGKLIKGNAERLPNPIKYTYLKDKKYSEEKELRISLSALGMGQFALKDGSMMQFLPYLHLAFDFKAAVANQVIEEILYDQDRDSDFLLAELQKLSIVPRK